MLVPSDIRVRMDSATECTAVGAIYHLDISRNDPARSCTVRRSFRRQTCPRALQRMPD